MSNAKTHYPLDIFALLELKFAAAHNAFWKIFILSKWLSPQTSVSDHELRVGLQMVTRDGILTQAMGNLTGGAFLVAFALLLGASNVVIGLIAALQSLAQTLQIPAIYLVEATRNRKALMVFGLFASRMFWLLFALIPWIVPICVFC